ncbi:MAG: peptide chain release factor-like protein [Deltaproteobacteria bacterium]|nr:peptide chain release factor-like protein [Deltaproteobacteria bacterium]
MSIFNVTPQKEAALKAEMIRLGVVEKDLLEIFVRSSGAGGQHVNKSATCVQLKHLPSGLEVKCQKDRSQALNRFYARRILCEKLDELRQGKTSALGRKQEKIKKQKARRRRRTRAQ